jgi:hypothetical protein
MAGGSGKRPSLRSGLGTRLARDFYYVAAEAVTHKARGLT